MLNAVIMYKTITAIVMRKRGTCLETMHFSERDCVVASRACSHLPMRDAEIVVFYVLIISKQMALKNKMKTRLTRSCVGASSWRIWPPDALVLWRDMGVKRWSSILWVESRRAVAQSCASVGSISRPLSCTNPLTCPGQLCLNLLDEAFGSRWKCLAYTELFF